MFNNSNFVKDIIPNLIYLNITELKSIANKFNISYNIYIEKDNNIIKTSEIDHKIIIINNLKHLYCSYRLSLIKQYIKKDYQ